MAQVNKIDSNFTGLRIAQELGTSGIGSLSGSEIWYPYEPNSYEDLGGEITTIARNPINDSRQRQKGVVTDLDASGGFQVDLVDYALQDIMQGFFFADLEPKGEELVTSVDATGDPDVYNVAATAGFVAGYIIKGENFANSANNGVNVVTAVTLDTDVGVANGQLVDEGTPPANAQIVVVGVQGTAGDIDVDTTGDFATLTTTTLDWSTLGLIPGEWIYVGGDAAGTSFSNAENNGFKRIRSVDANALVLDRSDEAMTTEPSSTETIRIFFGRVLRNRPVSTDIIRRTYQIERSLGAPDDAQPSQIQAEYIAGAVPGEITFNFNTADKATVDMSFVGIDNEQIDGPTSLKAGTRPTIVKEDAYNTSSDFSRLHMAIHSTTAESTTALFAYLTEFTVSINNNLSPNKAVGVLGAFDITAGQFVVTASATAYFSNVSAIQAVRNNADVSLDYALVHGNTGEKKGILMDVPLLALGDGRANVEQDEPITLPLTVDAGADRVFDHTLLMQFFDYLPDAADT